MFDTRSGPYEGRGPKDRLVELAFLAALAAGAVGLDLGSPQQVANGVLTVLIGIPLRFAQWHLAVHESSLHPLPSISINKALRLL